MVGASSSSKLGAETISNSNVPRREACKKAAELCESRGVDIAQLAVQYCVAHKDITTTVAGSANPQNVRNWAKWAESSMDDELLSEVLSILEPIKDIGHIEGLPENN